jgi:hypothetical protein
MIRNWAPARPSTEIVLDTPDKSDPTARHAEAIVERIGDAAVTGSEPLAATTEPAEPSYSYPRASRMREQRYSSRENAMSIDVIENSRAGGHMFGRPCNRLKPQIRG